MAWIKFGLETIAGLASVAAFLAVGFGYAAYFGGAL